MSVLGTGPKWRRGQRSGAVRVWPGGMRFGSTPSGTRLRLNNEAIRKASIGAQLYSQVGAPCDCCGPVAQLGERVNRTHEARGSNPLGSTNVLSQDIVHACGKTSCVSHRPLRAWP